MSVQLTADGRAALQWQRTFKSSHGRLPSRDEVSEACIADDSGQLRRGYENLAAIAHARTLSASQLPPPPPLSSSSSITQPQRPASPVAAVAASFGISSETSVPATEPVFKLYDVRASGAALTQKTLGATVSASARSASHGATAARSAAAEAKSQFSAPALGAYNEQVRKRRARPQAAPACKAGRMTLMHLVKPVAAASVGAAAPGQASLSANAGVRNAAGIAADSNAPSPANTASASPPVRPSSVELIEGRPRGTAISTLPLTSGTGVPWLASTTTTAGASLAAASSTRDAAAAASNDTSTVVPAVQGVAAKIPPTVVAAVRPVAVTISSAVVGHERVRLGRAHEGRAVDGRREVSVNFVVSDYRHRYKGKRARPNTTATAAVSSTAAQLGALEARGGAPTAEGGDTPDLAESSLAHVDTRFGAMATSPPAAVAIAPEALPPTDVTKGSPLESTDVAEPTSSSIAVDNFIPHLWSDFDYAPPRASAVAAAAAAAASAAVLAAGGGSRFGTLVGRSGAGDHAGSAGGGAGGRGRRRQRWVGPLGVDTAAAAIDRGGDEPDVIEVCLDALAAAPSGDGAPVASAVAGAAAGVAYSERGRPMCTGHRLECVVRTVKKAGPNKGRKFFSCACTPELSCNFFKWQDADARAAVAAFLSAANAAAVAEAEAIAKGKSEARVAAGQDVGGAIVPATTVLTAAERYRLDCESRVRTSSLRRWSDKAYGTKHLRAEATRRGIVPLASVVEAAAILLGKSSKKGKPAAAAAAASLSKDSGGAANTAPPDSMNTIAQLKRVAPRRSSVRGRGRGRIAGAASQRRKTGDSSAGDSIGDSSTDASASSSAFRLLESSGSQSSDPTSGTSTSSSTSDEDDAVDEKGEQIAEESDGSNIKVPQRVMKLRRLSRAAVVESSTSSQRSDSDEWNFPSRGATPIQRGPRQVAVKSDNDDAKNSESQAEGRVDMPVVLTDSEVKRDDTAPIGGGSTAPARRFAPRAAQDSGRTTTAAAAAAIVGKQLVSVAATASVVRVRAARKVAAARRTKKPTVRDEVNDVDDSGGDDVGPPIAGIETIPLSRLRRPELIAVLVHDDVLEYRRQTALKNNVLACTDAAHPTPGSAAMINTTTSAERDQSSSRGDNSHPAGPVVQPIEGALSGTHANPMLARCGDNSRLLRQTLRRVFGYSAFRGEVRRVDPTTLVAVPGSDSVVGSTDNAIDMTLQEWAVRRALSGRSSLLVAATGTGKSLCYQLPAYLLALGLLSSDGGGRRGITVVVSPLIALMRDQMLHLPRGLVGVCLSGKTSQAASDVAATLTDLRDRRAHVLFVSPERLLSRAFTRLAQGGLLPDVALLVVDEAHVLSEWSHNFRPAYLRLPQLIKHVLRPQAVLALTATATAPVVEAVRAALCVPIDGVWVSNWRRPNLRYSVSLEEDRDRALVDFLRTCAQRGLPSDWYKDPDFAAVDTTAGRRVIDLDADQDDAPAAPALSASRVKQMKHPRDGSPVVAQPPPCIVYVTSQADSERLANVLSSAGLSAASYHAGMGVAQRDRVYARFLSGSTRVVVATVAFGMSTVCESLNCCQQVNSHAHHRTSHAPREFAHVYRNGNRQSRCSYRRPRAPSAVHRGLCAAVGPRWTRWSARALSRVPRPSR